MKQIVTSGPRWAPRIGPGILLAILAALLLWRAMPGYRSGPGPRPPQLDLRPRVGLSAPDPEWLVKEGKEIGLDAGQMRQMRDLEARWQRDTRGIRAELSRATSDLAARMRKAGSGATLEQMERQATPISDLTRELLQARSAWWSQASGVMTEEQRKRAEQAWANRFSRQGAHM